MPTSPPPGTADVWTAASTDGPIAQAAVIIEHLQFDPAWSDTTSRRLAEIIQALAARHAALGHTRLEALDADAARQFVYAVTRRGQPPATATMHLRRTAVRVAITVMRQLGVTVTDPTTDLQLPRKQRRGHRPLEPPELTMLRVAAASRTRRRVAATATVALAEASATTGEIAALRWRAIDLAARHLHLPGAGPVMPRTVELTPWGHRSLTEHMPRRPSDPDHLVVYRGNADPESDAAQAAITSRLARLLASAGLDDANLRPGSVRLCLSAARLAAGGRIEDAARTLGLTSLDVTAEQLGWRWR